MNLFSKFVLDTVWQSGATDLYLHFTGTASPQNEDACVLVARHDGGLPRAIVTVSKRLMADNPSAEMAHVRFRLRQTIARMVEREEDVGDYLVG